MIEIERKFLVTSDTFKRYAFKRIKIVQGFLNTHPDRTVRVRLKGEEGFLTVKGKSSSDGTSRFEWEHQITKDDAQALLELCEDGIIAKTRHEIKLDNHIFEVDEFLGNNEGLVVAEIELKSASEHFQKPDWLGEEVTGDIKYYNSQLSKQPYNTWKK